MVQSLAATGLGLTYPIQNVLAADGTPTREGVRVNPESRRLERLIDRTPREQCPLMLVEQHRKGVPYRELLAGAFLYALLRDGHHSVYIAHSSHQLSLDVPSQDRLLPLVWAVDVMKEHLTRFKKSEVQPLAGKFPSDESALADFHSAMEAMDREKAEHAIIMLARSLGPRQAYGLLLPYAIRDNHFIGHIPIAVVNAGRVLDVIGWHHAEPVLRYIVRDMYRQPHSLDKQPYVHNVERVAASHDRLPADWSSSRSDPASTKQLYAQIAKGKWWNSNEWIVDRMSLGSLHAGSVWDAIHLTAANLMIRMKLGGNRLGNLALHSNTSSSALHHVFRTSLDSRLRLVTMFQAVSWVTEFTLGESNRNFLRDRDILDLQPTTLDNNDSDSVQEIFDQLPPRVVRQEIHDRSGQDKAAELAFRVASRPTGVDALLSRTRDSMCRKLTLDTHEMKYPIAMFEELQRVHPVWRPHLWAATVQYLQGSQSIDNPAVALADDAMKTS
ncbi:MAG: hypothetical protein AAF989_08570 [Planctomycetota bacterium]